MEDVKVSIIVCTYNQEKYIRQTLDSIISQKHPYSWELIVCDDASKDSTPKIVEEYASCYSEIIPVLRTENLGVVKNLFDGISRCMGEYVMICGGDDYYLPGKFKNQISFLECNPNIGMIHSDILEITEYGEPIGNAYGNEYSSVQDLIKRYNIKAPTMTFRTSDLKKYILEVDPMHQEWLMEDLPLSIWFKANDKMAYLPGVFAVYRIVQNSLSHQISPLKKLEFDKSAFAVLSYFQKHYTQHISKPFMYTHSIECLLRKNLWVIDSKKYGYKLLQDSKQYINSYNYLVYLLRIKVGVFNKIYLKIKSAKSKIKI